jgi:hypothetical protein
MDIGDETQFQFDVGPATPIWFIVPVGTGRVLSLLSPDAEILIHHKNEPDRR